MEVGNWSSSDNAKFMRAPSFIAAASLRNQNRTLVLELGQDEDGREGVERAEDHQLLHVQPSVDERDQIPLLRIEVEALEIREELRTHLRYGVHAAGVRQKVAHDGVAHDLHVAAQRQGGPGR